MKPKALPVLNTNKVYPFPKDLKQAKRTMRDLCKQYGYRITYDNKYKNFLPGEWNQAVSHAFVECAEYQPWNYDLLVFDVLHELGHMIGVSKATYCRKKNKFVHEFEAWRWAIDALIRHFHRNPSIRQAQHMMRDCMGTYLPNYCDAKVDWTNPDVVSERERPFWCPIQHEVLRK